MRCRDFQIGGLVLLCIISAVGSEVDVDIEAGFGEVLCGGFGLCGAPLH